MKFIAIGGEPGTGKTTVMRAFMESLLEKRPHKVDKLYGLFRGYSFTSEAHSNANAVIVAGIYKPCELFAGTDKLSMAVQKDAESYVDFVIKYSEQYPKPVLVFEGDRLFHQKFLDFCKSRGDVHALILTANDDVINERLARRERIISGAFLKGRRTKYKNLSASIPTHKNESYQDTIDIVSWMHNAVHWGERE